MPRMTHRSGDTLDIPQGGVKAMEALGWTVEQPSRSQDDDEHSTRRTRRRPGRPRKSEQDDEG